MVTFDPDSLAARIEELERELSKPGFWDDQQHGAAVSAEHARLTKRLERYGPNAATGVSYLTEVDPSGR